MDDGRLQDVTQQS